MAHLAPVATCLALGLALVAPGAASADPILDALDGEYTAMVADRILVQASGNDAATVEAILGAIDYSGLAACAP